MIGLLCAMHPQFYLGFWTGLGLAVGITALFGWAFLGVMELSDRAAQGRRFPE